VLASCLISCCAWSLLRLLGLLRLLNLLRLTLLAIVKVGLFWRDQVVLSTLFVSTWRGLRRRLGICLRLRCGWISSRCRGRWRVFGGSKGGSRSPGR
jgi:hypothetical protein